MSSEATFQLANALMPNSDVCDTCKTSTEPIVEASSQGLNQLADEELLKAVGIGSKEALGILFKRHAEAIRNVAWRILKDESEAADLRQEVFIYLFEHAKHFNPLKSSGISWIIQMTYHRAIDRRRFLSFRHHYKVEALDEQKTLIANQGSSSERIDARSILSRLRGQLSSDQQLTLELHFFEGHSLREIAERTGQTIGNVRHHYYRALNSLRSNLFSKNK